MKVFKLSLKKLQPLSTKGHTMYPVFTKELNISLKMLITAELYWKHLFFGMQATGTSNGRNT